MDICPTFHVLLFRLVFYLRKSVVTELHFLMWNCPNAFKLLFVIAFHDLFPPFNPVLQIEYHIQQRIQNSALFENSELATVNHILFYLFSWTRIFVLRTKGDPHPHRGVCWHRWPRGLEALHPAHQVPSGSCQWMDQHWLHSGLLATLPIRPDRHIGTCGKQKSNA